MVLLHKINGDEFILNSYHIEKIEERPDTVITLMNDRIYLVKESAKEVIDKVIEYQKSVLERLRA